MADEKYTFICRDANSSVYTALEQYLLTNRKGQWRKLQSDSIRFNLMMGDRNKLPYSRLGQKPGLRQLVNYYRGSEVICKKSQMIRELKKYCVNEDIPLFPWLPPSYVIIPTHSTELFHSTVDEVNGCENFKSMRKQQKDEREELLELIQSDDIWIAKSSVGSKGDDIMISNDVEELIQYIDNQKQAYIIQKYINNPFLLNHQRKFDIRCWVLVDSMCSIYLFKDGVLRTSSEPYNPKDLTDLTSHLTNHCLQKQRSSNFGMYEEGNEMFYHQFNEYLRSCGKECLEHNILPQIKDIIITCFKVIKERIDTNYLNYSSFQLFGFDFILDENFKVWLLEINGAPACAQKLLPDLIDSLVATAIDPLFPPLNSSSHNISSSFENIDS
ncbi:tubulin--tyrosine ligase [Patella vulgata]|uniref:tubulin--tyrosine ligase n=1 Tax=Patella vulgata TaxID=6465 RepID=UPI0021803A5C|nr:tubulin--tyrosine ligase [Patella vulgata]